MPTAALNNLLDELTPFSFLSRNLTYLNDRISSSAFPEILSQLRVHTFDGDRLPRIIPIACVQEPNYSDGKITGFSGKNVLFSSSNPRSAIITLVGTNIIKLDHVSNRDTVWGMLTYRGTKLGVCSFYSDITNNSVDHSLEVIKRTCPKILLLGDSNAHSTLWGSQTNNSRGDIWEHYLMRTSLTVLNNDSEITFSNHLGSSHIDISLTDSPDYFKNWNNTQIFNGSDHSLILVSNDFDHLQAERYDQNIARTCWKTFHESLPKLGDFNVSNTEQLEARAVKVIDNIIMAFNIACPPKRSYPGTPCKWWNKNLSHILRKKNLAARKARKFMGTPKGRRWLEIKRALGKLFQKTMRAQKSESWKTFINDLSGYKNISTLLKNMKASSSKDMPLLTYMNETAHNVSENLDLLRRVHFQQSSKTFQINVGSRTTVPKTIEGELGDFMNCELFQKALDSLPNGKAPGPDNIRGELLKQLPADYVNELYNQFKASLAFEFIPTPWLEVKAIFIKKGGDRAQNSPKTYRPIGLSSTILKLCERMVNWRLKSTVLKSGVPNQHAFTLGYSTETAISEMVHFLEKAKLNKQKVILLSIDIEGAFDCIPYDTIKQSLIDRGVEPQLIAWLDYLSRNRVIGCEMMGVCVKFRPGMGTTQGGINGPDIWIICLWAIILTEAAKISKLSKFADDLLSAIMGHDLTVIRDLLQACLTEFVAWFTDKGLTISAKKSYCMILNKNKREKYPKPLTINEQEIPFVDSFSYLGLIIDKGLTWRPHIQQRVRKAKSDLMVARKLVSNNWGLSPEKVAWVYSAIVRPAMEYSCHVWIGPEGLPHWAVKELDKVQRLALVSMTSCTYTTPTRALERLTNFIPLELHLKKKAACTVARIYNSVNKSNWDGIGLSKKRGHLLAWLNYLGPGLPPLANSNCYNFNNGISTNISNGVHNMVGFSIYTDGSKTDLGTGAGWAIFYDTTLITRGHRKLANHSTVYEAEMTAITLAIDDFLSINFEPESPKQIAIYVDNQAAIKSITSIKLKGKLKIDTVRKISYLREVTGANVALNWVKGHSDNIGNEMADEEAKKGCSSNTLVYLEPSMSFIKKRIDERVRKEWDLDWKNLKDCRQSRDLITFKPCHKESSYLFSRGRQGSRKLVSLLTGHNNLKYHVFKRLISNRPNISPCCRYCESDLETSWHLLFECPRLDTRRREFLYSPDNPKKGPDIEWYHGLAGVLGLMDIVLDRRYLDGDDMDD